METTWNSNIYRVRNNRKLKIFSDESKEDGKIWPANVDHHQDWWLVENGGSQKIKQHLMNVAVFFSPTFFGIQVWRIHPGTLVFTGKQRVDGCPSPYYHGSQVNMCRHFHMLANKKHRVFFASDMPITNFKRMYKLKWNWAVGNFPARSNET